MSRDIIIKQSKQAFVDALLRLLKDESFEDVTIKQLVLESGYSRRTYYRYFKDKRVILDDMFQQFLADYYTHISQLKLTPEMIPTALINALWPHHQTIQLLAQRELFVPLVNRHINEIVDTILTVNVTWRDSQDNHNYRYVLTYSIGGFCILINTILTHDPIPVKPDQLISELTATLTEIFNQWSLESEVKPKL